MEAGCTRCGGPTCSSLAGHPTDGISRISRSRSPNDLGWDVVVLSADGSHARRVGTASDYQTLEWAPDSSSVLFPGPRSTFEIVRADGQTKPLRIRGGDDPDWGL